MPTRPSMAARFSSSGRSSGATTQTAIAAPAVSTNATNAAGCSRIAGASLSSFWLSGIAFLLGQDGRDSRPARPKGIVRKKNEDDIIGAMALTQEEVEHIAALAR